MCKNKQTNKHINKQRQHLNLSFQVEGRKLYTFFPYICILLNYAYLLIQKGDFMPKRKYIHVMNEKTKQKQDFHWLFF